MGMENSAMREAPTAAQQRYRTSNSVTHIRSLPHERFGLERVFERLGRPRLVFKLWDGFAIGTDEDAVATITNIVDNYKTGEIYNIGGSELHSIEELSDTVLEITGADSSLVVNADSEMLTTKKKIVDTSKATLDLGHRNSISLEEGMKRTYEWMKTVYAD